MNVCIYVCICVHVCTQIYINIYISPTTSRILAYMYVCTHTHIHARTRTHNATLAPVYQHTRNLQQSRCHYPNHTRLSNHRLPIPAKTLQHPGSSQAPGSRDFDRLYHSRCREACHPRKPGSYRCCPGCCRCLP